LPPQEKALAVPASRSWKERKEPTGFRDNGKL